MRIRNIPAQITTVEDKIVGNLNLTQMFLLMVPVFWGMIIYTMFAPFMNFAWYKLFLFLIVGATSLTMAIRIKDKIILQWIVILLRFNFRPKYYVLNKNDAYLRTMDVIIVEKAKRKEIKVHAKQIQKKTKTQIHLGDVIRFENILTNPKYNFSIKSQKKGALYVAIEQKQ